MINTNITIDISNHTSTKTTTRYPVQFLLSYFFLGNNTVKLASETEVYFTFISDVFSCETHKRRFLKQ